MAGPLLGFLLGNIGKVAGANAQINQEEQQRQQLIQQITQGGLGLDPNQQNQALLLAGQGQADALPGLFGQANQLNNQQAQAVKFSPKVVPDPTSPTGFSFSGFNPQTNTFEPTGQPAAKPGALVEINNTKPLGADITKFVGPDGQTLTDPSLTPSDVINAGGQAKTTEQIKIEERVGTQTGEMVVLDKQLKRAQTMYDKALDAFNKDKSLANERRLRNAAAGLQTAIAGRENFRGEPSEGVAGRFSVPGPIRSLLEGAGGQQQESTTGFENLSDEELQAIIDAD